MMARADRLTLMDIHESNLEVCRDRLRMHADIICTRNNGYDFRPIADRSVTAIFCYDAMVHFSPDLVQSYLNDTKRVLTPGGMALFHHSNYAAPEDRPYGQNPHARNHMTFDLFCSYAASARLAVEKSEILDWGGVEKLDRLTLLRA
jgi:cyclopropane fatty-acyl-phospholipid synthase-like methyltransferase